MPFDYKKKYKEFYLPPKTPGIVTVPAMDFLAVQGEGDPNQEDGAYKQAIGLLYAVAFTIKMSKKGGHPLEGYFDYVVPPLGEGDPNQEDGAYKQAIGLLYAVAFTIKMSKKGGHPLEGYFDYVVPPLEGLWWQEGLHGMDYSRKQDFRWISLIRLPGFVTREVFDWAVREATEKKQQDFSTVEFFHWEEGLCVQCMHIGPYDEEPATVAAMQRYARWSFSIGRRGFASSACTSAPTMKNPPPWLPCSGTHRSRAMRRTSGRTGSTTRSI